MNITITISCDNAQEAQTALLRLSAPSSEYNAPVEQTTADTPKRTRKAKVEAVADPVMPSAAGTLTPAVLETGYVLPVDKPTPPLVAPQPSQQQLLASFVNLGQTKGPAAMKEVLTMYGAAAVTAIPPTQWASAIAECVNRASR